MFVTPIEKPGGGGDHAWVGQWWGRTYMQRRFVSGINNYIFI